MTTLEVAEVRLRCVTPALDVAVTQEDCELIAAELDRLRAVIADAARTVADMSSRFDELTLLRDGEREKLLDKIRENDANQQGHRLAVAALRRALSTARTERDGWQDRAEKLEAGLREAIKGWASGAVASDVTLTALLKTAKGEG